MLPRDLRVSRPANQRPVAPRLLLLTLHFCRPPPPAPRAAAKRRVVSRRFRFAHVSHPLVARPLLPAVQYSISTQARQPFWKLSLSLCFLFFHSLRRVSINCRHIHPVHSLSRPPALVADCRAVDQHRLLYGISQTRPIQRLHRCPNGSHNLHHIFPCAHSSIREKPALASSCYWILQTLTHRHYITGSFLLSLPVQVTFRAGQPI